MAHQDWIVLSLKPWDPIPAKLYEELAFPGIYNFSDEPLEIYYGEAENVISRVIDEVRVWNKSEIWHKCAPKSQRHAWLELCSRWTVSLLPVEGGVRVRRHLEKGFITDYCPLLNDRDAGLPIPLLHEARYEYFQDSGIVGIYRDADECRTLWAT